MKLLRERSRGGQRRLTAVYTLCINISLVQWLVAWISRQSAGLLLTRQHRGLCLLQLWLVHLTENHMQRVPEADVRPSGLALCIVHQESRSLKCNVT